MTIREALEALAIGAIIGAPFFFFLKFLRGFDNETVLHLSPRMGACHDVLRLWETGCRRAISEKSRVWQTHAKRLWNLGGLTMDRFNICQAYAQLESDYNVGGWLRERPSNQRRRESIGCQLSRMGFSNPHGRVDIEAMPDENDNDAEEVREIYMCAVLRLGLPIDDGLRTAMVRFFAPDYLAQFSQFKEVAPGNYKKLIRLGARSVERCCEPLGFFAF